MAFTVTLDRSKVKRAFKHYLASWCWFGWLHLYFLLVFFILPTLFIFWNQLFNYIIGILIVSWLLPIKRKLQPKFCFAFGDWIMKNCADYFHMKVIVEDLEALSASSPVIFATEPHDILPLSMVSFGDALKAMGTQKCIGCVSSACFSVPLMRHVWTWCAASSASRRAIVSLLNQGLSPVICPGGAREVAYLSKKKECVLFLNERLGFIKLAYRSGTPIVPVFSFGLRKQFDYWPVKNKLIQQIGRHFGFLPILFFGQFGTIFGPGKPCDLVNVVGKPILVPKKSDPTEAELRAVSKKYIDATREIFEKYKSEYGMSEYELRIL